MKRAMDLGGLDWSLRGWHAWNWEWTLARETGRSLLPVVGPVPVKVPGSVHQALRHAGVLPDWNQGLASLDCEWVENRHWTFESRIPAAVFESGWHHELVCDGLDHAGTVLCGGQPVGNFDDAHVPHRFDLGEAATAYLASHPGADAVPLVIAFTHPPRNLGQVGRTSRVRAAKPRFSYGWDWTPRLVQTGIWDGLRIESSHGPVLPPHGVTTRHDAATGRGTLCIDLDDELPASCHLEVTLSNGRHWTIGPDQRMIELDAGIVEPWTIAGRGKPMLHRAELRLCSADGKIHDLRACTVGFREVHWLPCESAPPGAEPWLCSIQGETIFLAGVNWTPILPNFADVTREAYRTRLETYRDCGFNLVRVWGGAVLEREWFYDLCDELGLLVWQEFPFCSSGIDNRPPDDPASIARAVATARSHIRRRAHHPSLLMWCGGNELQETRDGRERPLSADHPLIAALKQTAAALDPGRRFLPTSPQGPEFSIDPDQRGLGRHHCVHGPWDLEGTMDDWKTWWDASDALFHAEAGAPGASAAAEIRRLCGDAGLPGDASHPVWRHTASWWLQWEPWLAHGGDPHDLEAHVRWSQNRQAEALAHAMSSCLARFPRCGGLIVWMGHDCFPCPVNTSILDFHGHPKPAALALREVLRPSSTTA
jgi:beta-mannosidase